MNLPTNRPPRIWGVRQSLIGDTMMALPILNWLERRFPGSYKHWQVARKCSQSAQLYLNHPLIDKIVISDCHEGMGPRDIEIANTCDIRFDTMPQHPEGDIWPNKRTIYEETWVMAGLPLSEYHALPPAEQRAKLVAWFEIEKQAPKTVALWPCAGYGIENKRNASREWYVKLLTKLHAAGCTVYQFGHPRDYTFDVWSGPTYRDFRRLSFFDQIKLSLGCDVVIGTDSGSALVLGAYERVNQISLLTNHWPNHTQNFTAFATNSPLNTNFFSPGTADGISQDEVIAKILTLLSKDTLGVAVKPVTAEESFSHGGRS